MITTFTGFDLRNLATTQARRVLIPLAVVFAIGLTSPVQGLSIVSGALIGSVTASYMFQADERGLLDILYATTLVPRRAVVVGRYLSVATFTLVAVGLGTGVTLVAAEFRHQSAGWTLISPMLLISFGVAATAIALQLPFLFALGYTKGRPMVYIPFAVAGAAVLLAVQTGLLHVSAPLAFTFRPNSAVVLLVILAGVALIAASAGISNHFYRRREF